MPWVFTDDIAGLPGITTFFEGPPPPVIPGMITHAIDTTSFATTGAGGAEFLCLMWDPGQAPAVPGMMCIFGGDGGVVAGPGPGGPGPGPAAFKSGSPAAVAMAAVPQGQWGWFMITGNVQVLKPAGQTPAAGSPIILAAAPPGAVQGTPANVAAVGNQILNCRASAAAAAADPTVWLQLNRPLIW